MMKEKRVVLILPTFFCCWFFSVDGIGTKWWITLQGEREGERTAIFGVRAERGPKNAIFLFVLILLSWKEKRVDVLDKQDRTRSTLTGNTDNKHRHWT